MANKYSETDLDLALTAYFDYLKADYAKNGSGGGALDQYYATAMNGQKFQRVVAHNWGSRSAHSFIVKRAHVTSGGIKLEVGDILMAASWAAPALNAVRGNILKPDYRNCTWTGTGYLK